MKEEKLVEEKKWVHEYIESRENVLTTFRVALVVHNVNGGFVEDEYKFEVNKNGWLTIWSENIDFMSIDPVAAKDLMSFIKEYVK